MALLPVFIIFGAFLTCSGQQTALNVLTDLKVVSNNDSHFILAWSQPDGIVVTRFYIRYYQAAFDHSGGSLYVSSSDTNLARAGNDYTFTFPKDSTFNYEVYGDLFFYVDTYVSPSTLYSNGLTVAASDLIQSEAHFALEISLLGLDCEYARANLYWSNIANELEYVIRAKVAFYRSDFSHIEGNTYCRAQDQTFVFRGSIFTRGRRLSASDCLQALDQWLDGGQRFIVISSRHYYVRRPSCGLEVSAFDAPDCSGSSQTSAVTGNSSLGSSVSTSLLVSSIALLLVVVTIVVMAVYLVAVVCSARKKDRHVLSQTKADLTAAKVRYSPRPSEQQCDLAIEEVYDNI